MAEFYIEKCKNETGEYVVHSSKCSSLPANDKLEYLGARSSAHASVKEASNWYSKVSTCPKCLAA